MDATELKGGAQADVCRYGQPNRRHHPPLRPGKYLTKSQQNVWVQPKVHANLKRWVSKETGRFGEVPGLMDLLKIICFAAGKM